MPTIALNQSLPARERGGWQELVDGFVEAGAPTACIDPAPNTVEQARQGVRAAIRSRNYPVVGRVREGLLYLSRTDIGDTDAG